MDCQHTNRDCFETRNIDGLILRRRRYRCRDCGHTFHTAEIELSIATWNTAEAVRDILKRLAPELYSGLEAATVALKRLQDSLDRF